MSESSRGPLPAFGGPASDTKAYYVCKMCKKEVRRDNIREHYGVYVNMSILNLLLKLFPGLLVRSLKLLRWWLDMQLGINIFVRVILMIQ